MHTHPHPFNGPFSGTTQVSRYQKGKTNLDFTEARDSEWQWHQLGCMQICTSLQTNNHASTSLLSLLQAGCPSCRPTNSVKALKDVRIGARGIEIVNFTTAAALSAGTLMASAGTPYRLVPAHFYPCVVSYRIVLQPASSYPHSRSAPPPWRRGVVVSGVRQ